MDFFTESETSFTTNPNLDSLNRIPPLIFREWLSFGWYEFDRLLRRGYIDDLDLIGGLVGAMMPAQLPGTGEALSTCGTLERALGLVQPAMVAEIPRVRKLLPTVTACIVLVTGVGDPDVFLHVVLAGEVFAAVWTEDSALVHPAMVGVLAASIHLLATQLAPVQHLASMEPSVLCEIATD